MLSSAMSLLERILDDYNDQDGYSLESSLRSQLRPFINTQSIMTTDSNRISANMQWIANHIRKSSHILTVLDNTVEVETDNLDCSINEPYVGTSTGASMSRTSLAKVCFATRVSNHH
jgi:hypothetical protein